MTALDRYTRKTTAATTSGAQPATARAIGATSLLAPAQSRPSSGSGRAIGATTLAQAQAAPATAAAAAPAAAEPQIDWFSQPFNLTHYTFALENDPRYANDPLVQAPGLNEPHREGFLYSDTGILMQGTGKASDGRYITVDWSAGGPAGRNTRFTYGVGGTGGTPVPWKTVASDPGVVPLGSRLVLEAYRSKGEFTANDTGGAINGHHLDVFVGAISIQEAFQLGTVSSRVGIIKSGSLGGGTAEQDHGHDHGDGDTGALPVLRRGALGADVERLQQRLGVAVDGDFGPDTEGAVIAFQQAHNLDADGVVGPQTWAALEGGGDSSQTPQPDPTPSRPELRLGATGPDVIALQNRLRIQPTGTFGQTTESIVKRFQQSQGLPPTGVVDARTWAALDSASSSAVITANPNSENVLVGTSGGILGDRLLPHSTNLDEVMPHHGAAGDRHEQRAIEFDGAGNVATTTWPSSQAVPRVVIDGQEVRVTSRLPAPILRFIDGIAATDFTVGKRSDPDNQAHDIGRPVYSPFDMKVTEVDAGAGFLALEKRSPLSLDLGNGRTAQLYERIAVLHLDTVLVAAGQEVKAGEKIATQGNTGTRDVHHHIAGSNSIRIDFINAQTRAFAPAT